MTDHVLTEQHESPASSGELIDTDDGAPWTVQCRKRSRTSTSTRGSTTDLTKAVGKMSVAGNDARQQPRIPPIVIHGVREWKPMVKKLRDAGSRFDCKFVGSRLHVLCSSELCFRAAQRQLLSDNVQFHTFTLKEEQELKVVIRGLPSWTKPDDIRDELRDLGFTPTHAAPLQRRDKEGRHSTNSFYVRFRKVGSWTEVWRISHLMSVRVSVSPFEPRRGLNQCYNCQGYNHSSRQCHLPPRCVRCSEGHNVRDCNLPKTDRCKCANCGGEHPASYRGCEAHLRALGVQHRREASRHKPGNMLATRSAPKVAPRPARAYPPQNVSARRYADVLAAPNLRPEKPLPTPQSTDTCSVSGASANSAGAIDIDQTPSEVAQPKPAARQRKRKSRKQAKGKIVFSVSETEKATEEAMVPETPPVAPTAPPRRKIPRKSEESESNETTSPAPAGFLPASAVFKWISTLIPLVHSNLPPNELLAAILASFQELFYHG